MDETGTKAECWCSCPLVGMYDDEIRRPIAGCTRRTHPAGDARVRRRDHNCVETMESEGIKRDILLFCGPACFLCESAGMPRAARASTGGLCYHVIN